MRLGYTEHPGIAAVERFMKHYFLIAKDVGDLTRIFCAALEEEHAKGVPGSTAAGAAAAARNAASLPAPTDFIVDNHRINVADDMVFERDPVNLIRIFYLVAEARARIPSRRHAAGHPLAQADRRRIARGRGGQPAVSRHSDVENDPETVLRRMNEAGVLGSFMPDFGKIVAMMQFNMYHHYTVDEHLLRCIGVLAEIERGGNSETPLANELMHEILPNTGASSMSRCSCTISPKAGRRTTPSPARAWRDGFCPRLGFSAADTETVAWLIENHLVMSSVAQSRDLSDRKTIENFAAIVQSAERLKLLTS